MKTVFLIDDDADDREIFQQAIVTLNLDLIFQEAENGEDALNMLHNSEIGKPDIIFVDLNMPRMDGREFLLKVKNTEPLKDIPIIIYSTSSNPDDINFAMGNQATKFMTKQHSYSQLCQELHVVFSGI